MLFRLTQWPIGRHTTLVALLILTQVYAPRPFGQRELVVDSIGQVSDQVVRLKGTILGADSATIARIGRRDFTITDHDVSVQPTTLTLATSHGRRAPDWVLVFDAPSRMGDARSLARRIVTRSAWGSERFAVVAFDSRVRVVQSLTGDHDLVLKAIDGASCVPGATLAEGFTDARSGVIAVVNKQTPDSLGYPEVEVVIITDGSSLRLPSSLAAVRTAIGNRRCELHLCLLGANDDLGIAGILRASGLTVESIPFTSESGGAVGMADSVLRKVWHQALTPIELTWTPPGGCSARRTVTVAAPARGLHSFGVYDYTTSSTRWDLAGSTISVPGSEDEGRIWYNISFYNGDFPTTIFSFTSDDPDVVIAPTFSLPYQLQPRASAQVRVGYRGRKGRTIRIHPLSNACHVVDASLLVGGSNGWTGEGIVVTSPKPDSTYSIGDSATISWTAENVNSLWRIQLSVDGGASWNEVAPFSYARNYGWRIPPPETDSAVIRITGFPQQTLTSSLAYPAETLLRSASGEGGRALFYSTGNWVRRCVYYDEASVQWEYRIACDGVFAAGQRSGTLIAADTKTRTLHIVDRAGRLTGLDSVNTVPHALALLEGQDMSFIAFANSIGAITVKRLRGETLYAAAANDDVVELIPSSDGSWFVAGLKENGIHVYGLANATPIATLAPPRPGASPRLALTPDDSLLVVSWTGDSGVVFISTATWTPVDTILRKMPSPVDVSISPEGSILYYVRESVGVVGVGIASGEQVSVLPLSTHGPPRIQALADSGVATFSGQELRTFRAWPDRIDVGQTNSLFRIGTRRLDARNLAVDLGRFSVGRVYDTVVTPVLCNSGRLRVEVDSVMVYADSGLDCVVDLSGNGRSVEPGRCVATRVRIRLNRAGRQEFYVLIRTEIGDYSMRFTAEGVAPREEWSIADVDMGVARVGTRRDSVLRMALVNRSDDTIDVALRLASASDFRLMSDSMVTLLPLASTDIAFAFAPTAVGILNDILIARTTRNEEYRLGLRGIGQGSRLTVSASEIEFGGTCSAIDSAFVRLGNDGDDDLLIQRVELFDNDSKIFSISSPSGLYDRVLRPGDGLEVTVTLNSPVDSFASADIVVQTETANVPSGIRRVPIHAVRSIPSMVISPTVIRFPDVAVGDTVTATAWFRNVGWVPFAVRTPVVAGEWRLVSVDPPVTSSGDSSMARFQYYAGTAPGDYSQRLDLVVDPCATPIPANLSVHVSSATRGVVRVPFIDTGSPGSVEIPILLDHADRLAGDDSTVIKGELGLSAVRFVPAVNTPVGKVLNGMRVIPLELPISQRRGDTLATFSFLVHADEYFLAEPIQLDSFRTSNGGLSLSTLEGWVFISSAGPWMTIRAADDSVVSGDEVVIRLLLADSSSSGVVRSGYVEGELLLPAQLLDPVGATPQGSVRNGTRRIHIAVSLSEVAGVTLASLPFRAWSAVDTSVTIQLANFVRNSGASSVYTVDGQVAIRGVAIGPPEDSTGKLLFHAFPNPVSEKLHVQLRLSTESGLVRFLNIMGEEQRDAMRRVEHRGAHEFDMDLRPFPAGLYFLQLEDGPNRSVIGVRVER